ncbi:MAG: hypothetical protein V4490_08605 [Pseudomonadota bacterium]
MHKKTGSENTKSLDLDIDTIIKESAPEEYQYAKNFESYLNLNHYKADLSFNEMDHYDAMRWSCIKKVSDHIKENINSDLIEIRESTVKEEISKLFKRKIVDGSFRNSTFLFAIDTRNIAKIVWPDKESLALKLVFVIPMSLIATMLIVLINPLTYLLRSLTGPIARYFNLPKDKLIGDASINEPFNKDTNYITREQDYKDKKVKSDYESKPVETINKEGVHHHPNSDTRHGNGIDEKLPHATTPPRRNTMV